MKPKNKLKDESINFAYYILVGFNVMTISILLACLNLMFILFDYILVKTKYYVS